MHSTALVWFRRDLRLSDNPALTYARAAAHRVVPVYIHAPDEEVPWMPGAASQWWLHHSLSSLEASLGVLGSRLVIRSGPTLSALRDLIRRTGATLVSWNRLYEPACIARDKNIEEALREDGIEAESHNGSLLFEPWAIRTQKQEPFRVFTPFWRACGTQLSAVGLPAPAPKGLGELPVALESVPIDSLGLLPRINWTQGLAAEWRPGEKGALQRLDEFTDHGPLSYITARDRPDCEGTSRLSPHLHFGEISPRQLIAALAPEARQSTGLRNYDAYLREIGWREFAHHILYHFPHTPVEPYDSRFAAYPWLDDESRLEAWQRGLTGIPLVDAGMRQLWQTGWMHNRVRMIVASFLTKNGRMHWLQGARWFWDTLVDADLANNTLGWQWTAGCGVDAAPYFRVFNPVLQAAKFDPDRVYIRRWIPELAKLPDQWIHSPWLAPASVLAGAHIELGHTYPMPIVDLSASRRDALEHYKVISAGAAVRT